MALTQSRKIKVHTLDRRIGNQEQKRGHTVCLLFGPFERDCRRSLLIALLLIATSLFGADPISPPEPTEPIATVHGCYSGRIVIGSEHFPDQKYAEYMLDDGNVILVAISNDKPFYVAPSERCSDYQDPE